MAICAPLYQDTVLLVGAEKAASNVGTVYLFTYSDAATWVQSSTALAPQDGQSGDLFGSAVALAADTLTAAVAAPGKAGRTGVVYVFTRTATGSAVFTQVAKLAAAAGEVQDSFGAAIALQGTTLLVGAPFKSKNGVRSGVVYEFEGAGSKWAQKEELLQLEGACHAYPTLALPAAFLP